MHLQTMESKVGILSYSKIKKLFTWQIDRTFLAVVSFCFSKENATNVMLLTSPRQIVPHWYWSSSLTSVSEVLALLFAASHSLGQSLHKGRFGEC